MLRHNGSKRPNLPDETLSAGNMVNVVASDVTALPYGSTHTPAAGQNTTEARWGGLRANCMSDGWVEHAGVASPGFAT